MMAYLSQGGNENQRKLDQGTVSSLVESMETEHDRDVVRAIIAMLHTRSEISELIQHLHGGKFNRSQTLLRDQASCNCWRRRRKLKEKAGRISAEIKKKEEILNKKRETCPTKRV